MPDITDQADDWRPWSRVGLRFAFVWFLLIDLPFPVTVIPALAPLTRPFDTMWLAIVSFSGRTLFGLPAVANVTTGSGDRTYDFILLFSQTAIAIVVTLLWFLVDRRRNDERLYAWLRLYLRFALATAMLNYGAFKVIPAQFPPPTLFRLTETFGNASPMGLLWAFMGASVPYTVFAGLSEVMAGVLLIFRRTALLGALVSMAVLVNVVMLNFSYDVPVKIYSTELLLHSAFLAYPAFGRLLDLLVLMRPTVPLSEPSVLAKPALERVAPIAATAFLLIAFGFPFRDAYRQQQKWMQRGALQGLWKVQAFSVDGSPQALLTDSHQWKTLIFQGASSAMIQFMDDTRRPFAVTIDQRKKTFTLSPRGSAGRYQLAYALPQANLMVVNGTYEGRKIAVTLKSSDVSRFLLLSRGFHWINEVPFNR